MFLHHLQISGNQSRNEYFVSRTPIYKLYSFTRLLRNFRTLIQLYVLYTKQLFPATCYCAAAFYTFLLA